MLNKFGRPKDSGASARADEQLALLDETTRAQVEVMRPFFDPGFYLANYADVAQAGLDPLLHYHRSGWREHRDPSPLFSTEFYLEANPDLVTTGTNPLWHYVVLGQMEGRLTRPSNILAKDPPAPFEVQVMRPYFDVEFYISSYPEVEGVSDPVRHYHETGWLEGKDPAPWFSTEDYLSLHADVAAADLNPFLHFVQHGRREGRSIGQPLERESIYAAQAYATSPGPHFEEIDPGIGVGRSPQAKVLAYYLPQFHTVEVNDRNWGKGFTEWRNIARGLPRFEGHIQPRVPRDLGFYDLCQSDVMRRQMDMAKSAGIHGFVFYHYWFDGERVLEAPMERILSDPSLDMPFALMWANENWTRTWDGQEGHVLLRQSYRREDDEALVADFARHFRDPRYIRVSGRPLLFLYRPGQIPNGKETIELWRQLWRSQHGLDPLIYMAQGFGEVDPRDMGLDGAIEFPPHKVCVGLPGIAGDLRMMDRNYSGTVWDYDSMVERSLGEPSSEFPLIRTVVPSWDNEARRPGRGIVLHGSTPDKFEDWTRQIVEYAKANPAHGETFVGVNAWNEWAEGAVLEPDVHFGGAYLNALARAVFGRPKAG